MHKQYQKARRQTQHKKNKIIISAPVRRFLLIVGCWLLAVKRPITSSLTLDCLPFSFLLRHSRMLLAAILGAMAGLDSRQRTAEIHGQIDCSKMLKNFCMGAIRYMLFELARAEDGEDGRQQPVFDRIFGLIAQGSWPSFKDVPKRLSADGGSLQVESRHISAPALHQCCSRRCGFL